MLAGGVDRVCGVWWCVLCTVLSSWAFWSRTDTQSTERETEKRETAKSLLRTTQHTCASYGSPTHCATHYNDTLLCVCMCVRAVPGQACKETGKTGSSWCLTDLCLGPDQGWLVGASMTLLAASPCACQGPDLQGLSRQTLPKLRRFFPGTNNELLGPSATLS